MIDDNFDVKTYPDTKLCEIIAANRYLGLMRDAAIKCMEELATRRGSGSVFEYEKHIDELMGTLPKINLDMQKIMKLTKIIR